MFDKKGDLFGVHQKASKKYFSLDDYLQLGKISRFLFKMESLALTPYINEGDLLVVERGIKPNHGDFILGSLNEVFVCRRYEKQSGQASLVSNEGREVIEGHDSFLVFGVVVSSVRSHQ